MLTIMGRVVRHCDGVSRRQMLTAAAGHGGLSLADLLRAEDAAGIASSNKAIINVHPDGRPSQLETIDPKPHAPVEIRGEFLPVGTRLPGFQVSELFPGLAAVADPFTFIRSPVSSVGRHDTFQCQSGFSHKDLTSLGGRPALGCVISKLKTSPTDHAPAFVDLTQGRGLVRNSGRPGFLGPAWGTFRPDVSRLFARKLDEKMEGELTQLGSHYTTSLALSPNMGIDALNANFTDLHGRPQYLLDAGNVISELL